MNLRSIAVSAALMSGLLLGAVGVSAQTCTPVKLSKSYTTRDDGTGPYMTFVVDGTAHNQETTFNFTGASINVSVTYQGYVDVFAGYGGCTQPWSLETFDYYYGLYDLTEGKWVFDSAKVGAGNGKACGAVPACSFYAPGGAVNGITVTAGHSYHLWGFCSETTSVGTTAWYSDYVTINVQ